MKKLFILTAILIPTLLVGCSDPAQEKKERCTQLQNEATDAGMGKGDRKYSEIRKEWDKLQCHQTDIIHG
ncbi:hypothetical protein WAX86_20155 (plasmid) [Photobacterium damselae subsp. damselae]|uniref:hypothetical protein n=1 Tax=Photobacterium damselae TaxID=38293 RepID=UPI001EFCA76C|nr:hypothetical protein [Photobacterium damselae]MCG9780378.1 hypothetical protein [Photobacterium damselae]